MISGRKSGQEVRAFFAVSLPEDVRADCADLAGSLRAAPDGDAVRWVRPESLHLTLRFLGNVATETLPELSKQAGEAVADLEPFELRLGAPHAFPKRRPKVVALAIEPEPRLDELAARVESATQAAGLAAEKRAFQAHLTLGRIRSRRLPSLDGARLAGSAEVPVTEVVLFESDLRSDGAVYRAIDTVALGEGDGPDA